MPLSLATLSLGTREKCDIAVNYKIYDASEVPFHDDDKLRDWMYKVYKEKDDMLGTSFILVILIIGQYAFWFTSLYVQYRFYSYLLLQPFRLLGLVA
uniref:Acyltransferase C-terminal domain-containing protein n=1 Tax=Parascaris equorum TaxID=6256 RepID=A0A914SA01_PAREQ